MNRELERKLCEDFPELFRDCTAPITHSLMPFGCECGDGWEPIIREACAKLDVVRRDRNATLRFVQIKEKFGSLRLYMTGYDDEVERIIMDAEENSERTCEDCGAPGMIREGGWLRCQCDDCAMEGKRWAHTKK